MQSFVIFLLSAIQSISGSCLLLIHAYKQARDTIKKVNESSPKLSQQNSPASDPTSSSVPGSKPKADVLPAPSPSPLAVPGGLTANTRADSIIAPIPKAPPTPTSVSSIDAVTRSVSSSTVQTASSSSAAPDLPHPSHLTSPNYTHPPLTLLLTLLTPPPPSSASPSKPTTHTSALTALALAHTLSLPLTFLDPFISRLLPYLLYTHVLSASRLADVVRIARRALFPEGWPGQAPPDPTPEEQVAMRAELGRRLLAKRPLHRYSGQRPRHNPTQLTECWTHCPRRRAMLI